MNVKLKKLSEQVMVITGASSGIGLTTARAAAKRGARLVLAARNEDALREIVAEIKGAGGNAGSERIEAGTILWAAGVTGGRGNAVYAVADVGREDDVRRIAETAEQHFGGFDTWVNNAGVSIFGNMLDVSNEDHRQLFETNFWGVVYGSQVAARHLKQRGGGALINQAIHTLDLLLHLAALEPVGQRGRHVGQEGVGRGDRRRAAHRVGHQDGALPPGQR